jgi:hypothetical protein
MTIGNESRLRPVRYAWNVAGSGRRNRIDGPAHAAGVRLNMTVPFLRPVDTGTPEMCGRNTVRSPRKLFALDVQGG